jgi:hypothetical protein
MPILGILASSFRSGAGPEGAYDSLATVTVGSTAVASIDFVGIPSGYKHLQIRYISRCSRVDNGDSLGIQFNGDTGANYSRHYLDGNNSVMYAGASTSQNYCNCGYQAAANNTANSFGAGIMDILDYSSTSKAKTIRFLGGVEDNTAAAGNIAFRSGLWYATPAAITSIKLIATGGTQNFVQYSSFALYGVK